LDDDLISLTNDQPPLEPLLNPLFSMWCYPRATIRQILNTPSDTSSDMILWTLAALGGIGSVIDKAAIKSTGEHSWLFVVVAALIGGPAFGIIHLYISSALIHWTGKWINGKASFDEIKIANAWSNIPLIWALILTAVEIYLFGNEMFAQNTPIIDSSMFLTIAFVICGILDLIIGIWAYIILIKSIAEAQQFSAWAAIGNLLLYGVVLLVPILIIFIPIMLLK